MKVDASNIKKIKTLRDSLYNQTKESRTLIINDDSADNSIIKQIRENSIVINKEALNK